MKILKSAYHDRMTWECNGKLYPIAQLSVDNLWASVPQAHQLHGKEFYRPLLEDIQKNGLHFPLLCVYATYKDLREQKKRFGDKMLDLPFWANEPDDKQMHVIWGGSQRLRVAQDLGYTHVDCVMIPTLDEARGLQRYMRKPYNHLYK